MTRREKTRAGIAGVVLGLAFLAGTAFHGHGPSPEEELACMIPLALLMDPDTRPAATSCSMFGGSCPALALVDERHGGNLIRLEPYE